MNLEFNPTSKDITYNIAVTTTPIAYSYPVKKFLVLFTLKTTKHSAGWMEVSIGVNFDTGQARAKIWSTATAMASLGSTGLSPRVFDSNMKIYLCAGKNNNKPIVCEIQKFRISYDTTVAYSGGSYEDMGVATDRSLHIHLINNCSSYFLG